MRAAETGHLVCPAVLPRVFRPKMPPYGTKPRVVALHKTRLPCSRPAPAHREHHWLSPTGLGAATQVSLREGSNVPNSDIFLNMHRTLRVAGCFSARARAGLALASQACPRKTADTTNETPCF